MVKNISIIDKFTINNCKSIFNSKSEIYYIKENVLSKIFNFFYKNKIKNLEWKLINLEYDEINLFTSIIENDDVGKFVEDYLSKTFKGKEKDKNFYNFLRKYLCNNKNLISFMSIENFLTLYGGVKVLFNKYDVEFILEENIFQEYIEKKYNGLNTKFFFYSKIIDFYQIRKCISLLKKIFYIFRFNSKLVYNNKKICVMDSYQINKPENFFPIKNIYDKIIFISDRSNDKKNIKNIYNYLNKEIYKNLLCNLFKIRNIYTKLSILNILYAEYLFEKQIYSNFFKKNNIKIFLSSYLTQPFSSSAVAAMYEAGGSSIGFSTSYTNGFSSNMNIEAFDYCLSHNNFISNNYKNTNLKEVKYLGYINDYKFDKTNVEAQDLRKKLKFYGAKYIIGFFDQGSAENDIFHLYTHEISKIGYEFLIKKVIENDDFGLIIKPKKPKLLKEKLGKTYLMLQKAKATNRCFVFENHDENHVKNFKDIPAKIAKACDLTIHDTLMAGTAGLESALVGTKSVFFDYYKSKNNQFEEKGLNIVFRNWNSLWEEIEKDYNKKSSINLGDWSQIIDKFDKFRDGKANLRIIDFIKNLEK